MVGTLKEVATSNRSPGDIEQIIKLQNRKYAGITAPPQGLTLKKSFLLNCLFAKFFIP